MDDYDVFREKLAIKYPSYGHALWVPAPRNPDMPVRVGDVGFTRRGTSGKTSVLNLALNTRIIPMMLRNATFSIHLVYLEYHR